ncbi:hypothetical protein DICA3_F14818 [Diutina catenulata]
MERANLPENPVQPKLDKHMLPQSPPQASPVHTRSQSFGACAPTERLSPLTPVVKPTAQRSERRHSHSTPWVRRNSFLSPSMIDSEQYSVYEARSFFADGSYNIISLKECQGFVFNQDLFASPYQQSRSLANERIRGLSFSGCQKKHDFPRRHTMYHTTRPVFDGEADDDDDVIMDDVEPEVPEDAEGSDSEDDDGYDDDSLDMDDDGFNDSYRVEVTDVVVGEKEDVVEDYVRRL